MDTEQKSPALCTTNGKSVAEVRASQTNETGQHDGYIVLCPDERAKGFVRPYRDSYQHVGRLETPENHNGTSLPTLRVGCSGVCMTWQPIETAPKMRTILLFAVTDVDPNGVVRNWKMATGSWHTGYEDDRSKERGLTPWTWDGHQVHVYEVQPTHWMPLLDPPISGESV